MTTFCQKSIRCSVCGKEQTISSMASTSCFGSMDLDTRPPELYRFTMPMWIRRCSECGYCAKRLDLSQEGVSSIISSTEYQKTIVDSGYSETVNKFRCAGMLQKKIGDLPGYTWSQIHLAWIFDDLEDDNANQNALKFRLSALSGIHTLHNNNATLTDHYDIDIAIQTDLFRRTGNFNEAQNLISETFDKIERPNVKKSLIYQEKLIAQEDIYCHGLDEAMQAYSKLFPSER